MPELIFVTGNSDKFIMGRKICAEYGIMLKQKELDIDEIQSEDSARIARRKASDAFAVLKQPLIIRDDSWSFPGLRGFPGPYMKSINHWFSDDDFIRLTRNLTDRRAILTQIIVFQDAFDEQSQRVFHHETTAYVLTEAKGHSASPSENVLTIEGDNGLSINEVMESRTGQSKRAPAVVWKEFAEWYKEYSK